MDEKETLPGFDQVAKSILDGYKGVQSKTVKLAHPDLHAQRKIADTVRRYLDERNLRVAVYLDVSADPVELVLRPVGK